MADRAALAAAVMASTPAAACRMAAPTVLADVRHADAIVVGRVAGYRIVRNREFRRRMLQARDLPADLRSIYADPNPILTGDDARFDVRLAEVLAGRAPRIFVHRGCGQLRRVQGHSRRVVNVRNGWKADTRRRGLEGHSVTDNPLHIVRLLQGA